MNASRYPVEAEATIQKLQQESETLSRLHESQRSRLIEMQRENEGLQKKTKVQSLEISEGQTTVLRLKKEQKALLRKVAELEMNLENTEREVRDAKVYAELVEKMLDQANDASSPSCEQFTDELQKEIDLLQKQRDAERKGFHERIDELMATVAKSGDQIHGLTAHLEAVSKERDEAKKNASELTEKMDEMTDELADLNDTAQVIFNDRHALRVKMKEMREEHEDQRQALNNEIARLNRELRDAEQNLKSEQAAWKQTIGSVFAAATIFRNIEGKSFATRYESEADYFRRDAADRELSDEQIIEELKKVMQQHQVNYTARNRHCLFLETQITRNGAFWSERVDAVKMAHNKTLLENKQLLEKNAELTKEVSRIQEEFLKKLAEVLSLKQANEELEQQSQEDLLAARGEIERLELSKEALGEHQKRTEEQLQTSSRLHRMECHVRRDCEKRCSNLQREKSELTGMVVEFEAQTASMAEQIKRLVAERDEMEHKYRHVVENLGVEELSDEMLNFELDDQDDEVSGDEESCDDEDEQEEEEQNDE